MRQMQGAAAPPLRQLSPAIRDSLQRIGQTAEDQGYSQLRVSCASRYWRGTAQQRAQPEDDIARGNGICATARLSADAGKLRYASPTRPGLRISPFRRSRRPAWRPDMMEMSDYDAGEIYLRS
jgi:hypothetical protein